MISVRMCCPRGDRRGAFTKINDPAGAKGTAAKGISNTGVVAGFTPTATALTTGPPSAPPVRASAAGWPRRQQTAR
jgi:hypothetical protein